MVPPSGVFGEGVRALVRRDAALGNGDEGVELVHNEGGVSRQRREPGLQTGRGKKQKRSDIRNQNIKPYWRMPLLYGYEYQRY